MTHLAFHRGEDQPARLVGVPMFLLLVVLLQRLIDRREERQQSLQAIGQGAQRQIQTVSLPVL